MMNTVLFRREWKANYKLILIYLAVIAMYGIIVVYMYDPSLSHTLTAMTESMPEMMALMGMQGDTSTLLFFINTYLYGLLLQLVPFIFILLFTNRLVVHYVDRGSIACLLATPNRRLTIIMTQMLVQISAILTMAVLAALVIWIPSMLFFPGELDIQRFLLLHLGLVGLMLLIGAIVFCANCLFNETKSALLLGAGLPLFCYLCTMLGNLGEKTEWLHKLSFFSLFPAEKIVRNEEHWQIMLVIMVLLAACLYAIGARVFIRKDIPA